MVVAGFDGLLWAARHAESGEVAFGVVFVAVCLIVCLIYNAGSTWHVNVRNGLPYCPNCNRQVSYRRDYCRACGHKTRTFGGNPAAAAHNDGKADPIRRWVSCNAWD